MWLLFSLWVCDSCNQNNPQEVIVLMFLGKPGTRAPVLIYEGEAGLRIQQLSL